MTSVGTPEERYGALPPERIAALDAAAIESGVAIVMLMEVAGWQVARCAWRMLGRLTSRRRCNGLSTICSAMR